MLDFEISYHVSLSLQALRQIAVVEKEQKRKEAECAAVVVRLKEQLSGVSKAVELEMSDVQGMLQETRAKILQKDAQVRKLQEQLEECNQASQSKAADWEMMNVCMCCMSCMCMSPF